MWNRQASVRRMAVACILPLLALGCRGAQADVPEGRTPVTMWTHSAGNAAELEIIDGSVSEYHATQDDYWIVVESFPQGAYNDALIGAATTDDLPCLLDLDGPTVPNWAWAESIQPLGLPAELTDEFLPSTVSTWEGEIYAVGYFDVALSVLARRSVLEEHDIRIPTIEQPWTGEEFDTALADLAADPDFQYAIDMGATDTGEWWSYAYSPLLQSFGGDLIDRDTFATAEGALNGPEAIAFAEWFRGLFANGYSTLNPTPGREDFPLGNAALSWNGNWAAPRATEAFGDDALFLPPPDYGGGAAIGGASWQWAMSADCPHPEAARDYLKTLLSPSYITQYSVNTGLIPATAAGAAATEAYAPGGKLEIMFDMARELAVVRPPTPAYPVISSVFEKSLRDIAFGADPETALSDAVNQIDANVAANDAYGMQ
jgi:multiple sugar transport system substrate-binding protein